MSYAVEVEGLTYVYPSGVKALNNVTLRVREGECAAILGPNGSGKTTLLLNIAGVLRGDGIVRVCGLDVRRHFKEVRRLVGLVFQNPDDQIFTLTVYDEVSFGLRSLGLPEDEVRKRVREVLEYLGLSGCEERSTLSLSFGEKKKVALASVLVLKPRVLLLDEPTLALDPGTREELIEILVRLRRERKTTILIATHDVDAVPLLADTVYVMSNGKIVSQGRPEDVLTDESLLARARLRPPHVSRLFLTLRRQGVPVKEVPLTVERACRTMLDLLKRCPQVDRSDL